MEYVSKEIEAVMGYLPSEFEIGFMNDQIHPEDRSWFLAIGSSMIDFFSQLPLEKVMKYKVRYDIRFRKKNGDYARILYQGVILEHDQNGRHSTRWGSGSDQGNDAAIPRNAHRATVRGRDRSTGRAGRHGS